MSPPRVLVTGAGGPAGRALTDQLRGRGIRVVGTDMSVEFLEDDVVRVPPASDPAFIESLMEVVTERSIDVVVPTVSEELPSLAAARRRFPDGISVLVAEPGPVRICDDKLTTARALAARGVAVPPFALPSECAGLQNAFERLGWPVVAKPRVSRGGRGVVVLRSDADMDWARLDDRWILQRFAPGVEYAPVTYRGRPDGTTTVVVLEKTGLKQGEIGNAVDVRRVSAGDAPDVAQLADAVVAGLALTGPADIDIRRLADGRPVVLEVNARFGANSRAAPELLDRVIEEHLLGAHRAA